MGRFRIGNAGKTDGGIATGPVTAIREIDDLPQKRSGYSPEHNDDKLNGIDGSPERQVSPTLDDVERLDDAAYAAAEKRLVRKLDFIFLPSACVGILMKKIDQTNYKAAYTAGMRDDLNLAGTNVLNWLDIYFTISFAIFMVPSVLIMMRVRPSLWLPSLELIWGILTGCMALANTPKPMYVIRFLIGVCEASAWPGTTVLLLSWYTPKAVQA